MQMNVLFRWPGLRGVPDMEASINWVPGCCRIARLGFDIGEKKTKKIEKISESRSIVAQYTGNGEFL